MQHRKIALVTTHSCHDTWNHQWTASNDGLAFGGCGRNRTDVHGFAGRCITTLPLSLRRARLRLQPGRDVLYQEFGAGNETRTRVLNLGKVALYQLSYSRVTPKQAPYFSGPPCAVNRRFQESPRDMSVGQAARR